MARLLGDPDVTTVRSVARRPLPPHPKLRHTQSDLRSPDARRAVAGVDVLFHLGFGLWRRAGAARGDDSNVDGTTNVVAAEPGRIVFASSAAVYGAWPDSPVPIDEDVLPRPNRECPYAEQKLAAEAICADAAPAVALRISAVLGPGADPQVVRAAQGYRRVVPAMRGRRQALQFLHEDDAAAALLAAGRSDATGVLNVATRDWLDADQVADIGGGRVLALPERPLLTLSEVAFRVRLLDFGADRAVFLRGPLALDPSRAAEKIGWHPSKTSAEVLRSFLTG